MAANASADAHGVLWTCRCGRAYRLTVSSISASGSSADDLIVLPPSEIPDRPHPKDLDEFQVRVLGSIASGLTDREIADSLRVSLHRVRYAVRDLIGKLSARTRSEAVFVAATSGLLDRIAADPSADPRPGLYASE